MKNKILKISIILLLIMTMTMANVLLLGKTLISYATDDISTNVKNIEFGVYFKNENGEKVNEYTPVIGQTETSLFIQIAVKQDGYLNGQIELSNTNFNIKSEDSITSKYINEIQGNTIILNQINAGATVEIEVKVELLKEEIFDLSLFDVESEIQLKGTYKNSTEKDISVEVVKKVKFSYPKANIEVDNIVSEMNIITNKDFVINGEKRRIVQVAMQLGLKSNTSPIKNITIENQIPVSSDKSYPEVSEIIHNNMMTSWKSNTNSDTSVRTIEMMNEEKEGKIIWKNQGNEEIIITYIAKQGTEIQSQDLKMTGKIVLYDGQEIDVNAQTTLEQDKELNNMITVETSNKESTIYKGKLYQGISREFSTNTTVNVNLAKTEEYLEIKENNVFEQIKENQIQRYDAKILYQKTILIKEEWTKILGEQGNLTVLNQTGEIIATIDKNTQADEQGNIILNYEGEQEKIILKTTGLLETGELHITHQKVLKDNTNLKLKEISSLKTIGYVTNETISEETINETLKSVATVELKEPITQAKMEVNKESLSTAISNSIEIKAILKTDSEEFDLYQNPVITFTLPEDVENIELTKVEMLYEEELKIKEYKTEGRTITVMLEGKQTQYKEKSIEGANIVIYADITLNKKAATKDAQIQMSYTNQNTTQSIDSLTKSLNIVAPTEITTIYNIATLGIETIGQEENRTATLAVGADKKQLENYIEIVNNKSVDINDVKILGIFPTANNENTIASSIVQGISVAEDKNVKIYYTENENATQDLENTSNGWSENIIDSTKVRKYLIVIDKMESQDTLVATYQTEIPEKLEYNQGTKQWYEASYTDSQTMTQNEVKSTVIEMTTGVGPRIETTLTGKVGTQQIKNGDMVKAGEVIKYYVDIKNTGTEEIKNLKVIVPIPEGTTYVEPKQNYEYTGSSYYQEVQKEKQEEIIETIKPGEEVIKEYEVRVNKDIETGKQITNVAEIIYAEMTKKTNEIQCIAEAGDVRVSVKRVTDRNTELYTGGAVQYFAIIENTSKEVKENLTIETDLPKGLVVERLIVFTGMEDKNISDEELKQSDNSNTKVQDSMIKEEDLIQNGTGEENLQSETLEYSNEILIGTMQPEEVKVLSYDITISRDLSNTNIIPFSVIAKDGNQNYRSNQWIDTINHFDISINMTSNRADKYVKAGDTLDYTITVKNDSDVKTEGLTITDEIPEQLTITKITKDDQEINLPNTNYLEIATDIESKTETVIKIETEVNYVETQEQPESITNKAEASVYGTTIATTGEIVHIIELGSNTDGNNDVPNNDIATGSRMISGVAWYDENVNGKKEDNEKLLSGITVKLLNVETNQLVKDRSQNVLQATTNDKGVYVLNYIGNGKYVAIFEYDANQYALTKYQAEGTIQSNNSNIMMNELSVEGNKQQLASTDILEINNNNIADINAGFIKLQNFDLKLDKYVSKIMIQNRAGTTVRQYTNETMAKVELDGKTISGTTVIIEYQIKVANVGEIPGYVKKVADYIPSDLNFNSELNKDWYKSGEALYNTSLANTKLAAGEEKTLTLTLTKTMNENNIGRVNNTAEIVESYNELGIQDSNSTPGNKVQGENDMGLADVIIGIKTGEAILYTSIIGTAVVILGVTAILFQNKRIKKSQNTKKLDKIS